MKNNFLLPALLYSPYKTTITRSFILFCVCKHYILFPFGILQKLHYMRLYIIIRHVKSDAPLFSLSRYYNW